MFGIFLKLWCLDGIPTYGFMDGLSLKKLDPGRLIFCIVPERNTGWFTEHVCDSDIGAPRPPARRCTWMMKNRWIERRSVEKRPTRYGDSTKLCWDDSCYIIFSYNIYFGTCSTFHCISTSITHSFPWLWLWIMSKHRTLTMWLQFWGSPQSQITQSDRWKEVCHSRHSSIKKNYWCRFMLACLYHFLVFHIIFPYFTFLFSKASSERKRNEHDLPERQLLKWHLWSV